MCFVVQNGMCHLSEKKLLYFKTSCNNMSVWVKCLELWWWETSLWRQFWTGSYWRESWVPIWLSSHERITIGDPFGTKQSQSKQLYFFTTIFQDCFIVSLQPCSSITPLLPAMVGAKDRTDEGPGLSLGQCDFFLSLFLVIFWCNLLWSSCNIFTDSNWKVNDY